jgi:hypothetical protein
MANTGTEVEATTAPGIRSTDNLDDVPAPGRRIVGKPGPLSGGAAGAGTAPMGGRPPAKGACGDGMINEEDRGSAYDY